MVDVLRTALQCFSPFDSIISVKAKSFADREIRYTLKAQGQGAGTFNIGPTSGIVKLAKELDFEDLRQPHVYQLIVTATEDSGGFSTSVEVSGVKCVAGCIPKSLLWVDLILIPSIVIFFL